MNKKYLVFNWKMYPKSLKEADNLLKMYKEATRGIDPKGLGVVMAPPFLYLNELARKTSSEKIAFSGQDCFWEKEGPFTGEISPLMLKNVGCNYVILGHSSRRQDLGENDEMINRKVKAALKERLKVILCVGEKDSYLEDKNSYLEVGRQLKANLKDVSASSLGDILVAYEPIWAISTSPGACPQDPNQALSSILYLRKLLAQMHSRKVADKSKILYGGSVDSKNIKEYFGQDGIDGVLVGGASLNGSEVIKIFDQIKV